MLQSTDGRRLPFLDIQQWGGTGTIDVLFFSRGRGRGHAVPDMAILDELRRLRNDIVVQLVSYATGASAVVDCGHSVIDLDLPENNSFLETLLRASHLIQSLQPRLVVSHEEFAVMPAAKIAGVPSVFITEWFSPTEEFSMDTIRYADYIICLQCRGIFEEPEHLKGRVEYVGPVVRPMSYGRGECVRARSELGFSETTTIISVMPGSWIEKDTPIFDLVMPAYDALAIPDKLLVWIAGRDCAALTEQLTGRPDVIVKESYWPLERLMVASNLCITKGNRVTIMELAALGIPSVSLSFGLNPIDDAIVLRIPTNSTLNAKGIDCVFLAEYLKVHLEASRCASVIEGPGIGGAIKTAEILERCFARLTGSTKS